MTKFIIKTNTPLNSDSIPNSTTNLKFAGDFNQPLKPGVIPLSVTHLRFDAKIIGEIDINPGTKITCNENSYEYFLMHKFRHINLIVDLKFTHQMINAGYIMCDDELYTVIVQNINCYKKISLILTTRQVKSANKI